MLISFAIVALLAAVALGGWANEWSERRATEKLLALAEYDRDVALGWEETQQASDIAAHPTLHLVDGGEA